MVEFHATEEFSIVMQSMQRMINDFNEFIALSRTMYCILEFIMQFSLKSKGYRSNLNQKPEIGYLD